VAELKLERKWKNVVLLFYSYYALTRRHTGAAFASGLPAASSICA
jgi:hypothetical protein